MRYLLDTHVVLWWYLDSSLLKKEHRRLIADGDNEIYVSAAVIWEIEVKRRNGKLDCPPDMLKRIKADGIKILPIVAEHLVPLRTIPPIHNDPFDRMLLAQAKSEGIKIMSHDRQFPQYGDFVIPV